MGIVDNLNRIRSSIEEKAVALGRKPEDITLVAVSKTKPAEDIITAIHAGQVIFGENRVQEALNKQETIQLPWECHLIGHLQSNKVKMTPGHFALIHSVDSLKLAQSINERNNQQELLQDILLQVNCSDEDAKSGFTDIEEFKDILGEILLLKNIRVTGLMTMAPWGGSDQENRKSFKKLRNLMDQCKALYPDSSLKELSMGMSGDYLTAIEEGSTMVRVGSSIFGYR